MTIQIHIPLRRFLFFGPLTRRKTFTRRIPSTWNECTPVQVGAAAICFYSRHHLLFKKEKGSLVIADEALFHTSQVSVLYYLLAIPRAWYFLIPPALIHSLLYEHKLTGFFFKENTLTRNPLPTIPRSRSLSVSKGLSAIPSIFGGHRPLLAPADGLSYIEALEFAFTDTFYLQYKKTGDITSLHYLIAVLYRPMSRKSMANNPNDPREPFNQHRVESRLPAIAALTLAQKLSILIWYEAIRAPLPDRFVHVFSSSQQKEVGRHGWEGTMLRLAGSKFGPLESTYRTPVLTLFTEMDIILADHKRQEAELEKLKSR